jgi:hypothetical protein
MGQNNLSNVPTKVHRPMVEKNGWSWWFVPSSLVVIRRFARMSWSRRSSFRGVTVVHGRPERCLFCTSQSPMQIAPLTTSLCSHPLFGLRKRSASVGECHWVQFFFCMEEFHYTLLFHTHCHVRRHLSDCPIAVICRTATKFKGILAGRFHLYCHINSVRLWRPGPTY